MLGWGAAVSPNDDPLVLRNQVKCTNSSNAYACITSVTFTDQSQSHGFPTFSFSMGKWIIFLINNNKYKNLSGLFVLYTVPLYIPAHCSLPEILWRRQNFFHFQLRREGLRLLSGILSIDGLCQSCDYKESPFHCSSNALPVAGISGYNQSLLIAHSHTVKCFKNHASI